MTPAKTKPFLLTILCLLAVTQLSAQTKLADLDSAALKLTRGRAEKLIPRPALRPVRSMEPKKGEDPIDTIDTTNPAMKIILMENGTWKYWKDGSEVSKSSVFSDHWDNVNVDPFKLKWDDLPDKANIWLVDSTYHYHYPGRPDIQVSSRFGKRHGRWHRGIDIRMNKGEDVYATFDGKVRMSKYMSGYGYVVVLRHENGLETFYGHLSKMLVKQDDWVEAGQKVGLAGATGRASGPHLHYELRYNGYAIDPEWMINFENGDLRHRVLVVKKKQLSPDARFVSESDEDEELIAEADEKDRLEAERIKKEMAEAKYYTVKSGDTLSRIAQKNGTTVNAICKLNGITTKTILKIGRKLRVK